VNKGGDRTKEASNHSQSPFCSLSIVKESYSEILGRCENDNGGLGPVKVNKGNALYKPTVLCKEKCA